MLNSQQLSGRTYFIKANALVDNFDSDPNMMRSLPQSAVNGDSEMRLKYARPCGLQMRLHCKNNNALEMVKVISADNKPCSTRMIPSVMLTSPLRIGSKGSPRCGRGR